MTYLLVQRGNFDIFLPRLPVELTSGLLRIL